jgi:hypothetical protein
MPEVWLRTNRRAHYLMMALPAAALALVLAALGWSLLSGQHWGVSAVAGVFAVGLLWLLGGLVHASLQPRIGFEGGDLLVYHKPGVPTRVPIDVVEVFFMGQGASELPPLAGREPETQNIVIRLAESAAEWKHREMWPAFGMWCESYITLRGSWCEPITPELMQQINNRLIAVQRERKAARLAESSRQAEAAR